jgi:hypothetical protein
MLKHFFTERDNTTFCPVRLVGILGALEHLALSAVNYRSFDAVHFGTGLGAVIGALGVAVGFKAATEKAPQ